jgi:hypothetical protein
MSATVSALSTAVEAVSAIASLAFGASGGVVLGEFVFAGFEVPEFISLPGTQQMTVHKLVGGERQIDAMGDDPGDITWSGCIMDGDPMTRAQELIQMRAAGAPLPLQWGSFFYTVVIHSFTAKTLYGRVNYDISCTVQQNEATAPTQAPPDLTDAVNSDMSTASATAPADAAPAVGTASTGVASAGTLTPGSSAVGTAQTAIAPASTALQTSTDGSGAALGAAATGAPSGALVGNSSDLAAATGAAGDQAQSVQSAGYLGRAQQNLDFGGVNAGIGF